MPCRPIRDELTAGRSHCGSANQVSNNDVRPKKQQPTVTAADQFRPTRPVNPAYYGPTPPSLAVPRKRKRVFMWFFLAVQALFVVWLIAGANSSVERAARWRQVGASG